MLSGHAHAVRLEAGQATTTSTFDSATFTRVDFQAVFDEPPVVVALATTEGSDSSALRIRNVTNTGFDVAPLEPPGDDGPHVSMTIDYIAMEPGVATLPGGEVVAAGFLDTSTVQRAGVVGGPSGFETLNFGAALSNTGVVLADVQTDNSESGAPPGGPSQPWLTVVVENPTNTTASIALERSEVAAGVVSTERIGWIAFPDLGTGAFAAIDGENVEWRASQTADVIVGFDNSCVSQTFSPTAWPDARVVATKNSRDGGDGGWLRRCALTSTTIGLVVDEDVANDTERAHTTEIAGVLAFSRSFHADLAGAVRASKTVSLAEDPVNGDVSPYGVPGARVRYALFVESVGNAPIDSDTIVLTDELPSDVALIVEDIEPSIGPVRFSDGSPTSGLTFTFGSLGDPDDDLSFSNDDGATFTYTPVASGDGADPAVTHVRVAPKGALAEAAAAGAPSFTIEFDAIVR